MPRQHEEQAHEQHSHLPAVQGSSKPAQWSDLDRRTKAKVTDKVNAENGENVFVACDNDSIEDNVGTPPEFLVKM